MAEIIFKQFGHFGPIWKINSAWHQQILSEMKRVTRNNETQTKNEICQRYNVCFNVFTMDGALHSVGQQ